MMARNLRVGEMLAPVDTLNPKPMTLTILGCGWFSNVLRELSFV